MGTFVVAGTALFLLTVVVATTARVFMPHKPDPEASECISKFMIAVDHSSPRCSIDYFCDGYITPLAVLTTMYSPHKSCNVSVDKVTTAKVTAALAAAQVQFGGFYCGANLTHVVGKGGRVWVNSRVLTDLCPRPPKLFYLPLIVYPAMLASGVSHADALHYVRASSRQYTMPLSTLYDQEAFVDAAVFQQRCHRPTNMSGAAIADCT